MDSPNGIKGFDFFFHLQRDTTNWVRPWTTSGKPRDFFFPKIDQNGFITYKCKILHSAKICPAFPYYQFIRSQ